MDRQFSIKHWKLALRIFGGVFGSLMLVGTVDLAEAGHTYWALFTGVIVMLTGYGEGFLAAKFDTFEQTGDFR